jgi:hypothetical protein
MERLSWCIPPKVRSGYLVLRQAARLAWKRLKRYVEIWPHGRVAAMEATMMPMRPEFPELVSETGFFSKTRFLSG